MKPMTVYKDLALKTPERRAFEAGAEIAPSPSAPSPSLNALLARTVKRLRQERGLSQEDLAGLAKVDRTYISGIERARRNITIGTLERLIPHLAQSPAEFFQKLCSEMQSHERVAPMLTTHRAIS
jgi:DNA-binding XRE family transcriptional regulator